jgi:predicted TIM-barrel fold metal-dependent hydrolase
MTGIPATNETIISADSHVMETPELWADCLPSSFWPDGGASFKGQTGGHDPKARLTEMEEDGVNAEVLYPTLGLKLFGLDDADVQERAMRMFNDWLIDYCQVDTSRLVGVAAISAYNIEHAVAELERCKAEGLGGFLLWQATHPDMPFTSERYDPLWAAAQELEMPLSLHILTGHNYSRQLGITQGIDHYRGSVNLKLLTVTDAVMDIIFSGVLERFPRLKVVLVENEVGWLPFVLSQWDYYFHRFREVHPLTIDKQPSDYFYRQVYATFFRDPTVAHLFDWWGADNCMWSNDYPHPNSTWPNSRDVIAKNLGHLPEETREKLLRGTVRTLYNL